MRILNCYMANDSKGHFVTAKEAAKHNRQDVLCCVSCGCPLTLQRGNDGQPPWFEHDQMTVAEKILLRCTWLDPAEKEARRLHLQGMTCLLYTSDVWWMYLGGPLGLMSIGLMAILVRGLGLLMLGVASTAGQLLGSVLIDVLIPSLGNTVYLVTIIGTLFALVGAIVTTIPEYRTSKTMKKMEV